MIEELLNFKKLNENKTYALERAQNALFYYFLLILIHNQTVSVSYLVLA